MREILSEETPAPASPESAADETAAAETPRRRESRPEKVRDGLEAILFSSSRPVSELDLAHVLEATPEAVRQALADLAAEADVPSRGVRLERVGGGWRYVTRPEFDSLLRKFHEVSERSRLSLPALETLAIIAYRQPITLPEVQEIRGVNSSSVLKTLFEKKLISTAGKKAVVGTPFLYKTTPDFLVRFGLNDLEELPKPEEIEEDLAATVPQDLPPPERPPTAEDFRGSDDGEEDEEGEPEGHEAGRAAPTAAISPAAGVPPSDLDDESDADDESEDEDEPRALDAPGEPADEDDEEEDDDEDDDDEEEDDDDEDEDEDDDDDDD